MRGDMYNMSRKPLDAYTQVSGRCVKLYFFILHVTHSTKVSRPWTENSMGHVPNMGKLPLDHPPYQHLASQSPSSPPPLKPNRIPLYSA